jgi:hypothetical protein
MVQDIWFYEYPIWVSYYKDNKLFGLLPREVIKTIIDIVMKNIIKKRKKLSKLQLVKEQITYKLDNNATEFHFQNGIKLCNMNIAKYILLNLSKTMNKQIKFSHICCEGKGMMFEYVDDLFCKLCENNKNKKFKRLVYNF